MNSKKLETSKNQNNRQTTFVEKYKIFYCNSKYKKIYLKLRNSLSKTARLNLSENETIELNYEDLKIVKHLGNGVFGIVYKMAYRTSDLSFAVKV